MAKTKNIFVCIGAIHHDYLLNLKNNIIKKRTNPIIHNSRIGGVAYNVAELISIFEKIEFYSLNISLEIKNKISKNISIKKINNDKSERYYVGLSDKNSKFLLGLANTDVYENIKIYKIPNIVNKYIVFDLNFSKDFIENAINKLSPRNKIIVCATSVHKILKIKKVINQIDIIFLNKAELIRLTNIASIENGIKRILKINNKIKIIATNSKNNVIYGDNKSIIKIKPPKIKVQNENGAGDALTGMMLYLLSKGYNQEQILKYSVACGSYYASGNRLFSKKDLLKIKNISRQVILK
tara:strand:- start:1729 stop:2616 length:888 start_codon:yes stop_codon:yes gene_type:complete